MDNDQNENIKFSEIKELYKSLRNRNCYHLSIGILMIVCAVLVIACGCRYDSVWVIVVGTIIGFEAVRLSGILIYSLVVHKDMYDRLKETYGEEEEDE